MPRLWRDGVRRRERCRLALSGRRRRPGPFYCADHAIAPGDTVRDRETGSRLTVVDVSEYRADAVEIRAADCTVAEYETNEAYDPNVPVVAAVYPTPP